MGKKLTEGFRNWFRDSLRLLFLLYFQPTKFGEEVEGKNNKRYPKARDRFKAVLGYHLRLFPWIVLLAFLFRWGAGAATVWLTDPPAAQIHTLLGWESILRNVALGVTLCVVLGVASGMVLSVAFGVAFGVVEGVVFGVAFGMVFGVVEGVVFGVAVRVMNGVAASGNRAANMVVGAITGLVIGVLFVVTSGVVNGVMTSVAFWIFYFCLDAYLVDAVLAGVAFVRQRYDSFPVFWNEAIWLPLPFSRALVRALIAQDRDDAIKKVGFVLSERKTQRRWLGRWGQEELLKHDLKAESLTELVGVAGKLTYLSENEALVVWKLVLVSERMEQYLALRSPAQKTRVLGEAQKGLGETRVALAGSRSVLAPTMLAALKDWERLLEEEKSQRGQGQETELPNPFVFGNPLEEQRIGVFRGRQDIAGKIEAALLSGQSAPTLLLYGPRRMGKTSVLIHLSTLLSQDFAPCFMDCQSGAVREGLGAFLYYACRAMTAGLKKRRVTVVLPERATFDKEPFGVFEGFLEAVEAKLPETMRVLLCLDEFERLEEKRLAGEGWVGDLLDELRHLMQHRRRFVVMFTGAHTFGELGAAWTDRFISARSIRVGRLTPDEARALVTEPEPDFPLRYASQPDALEALLSATACHPLVTQAVAYELIERLNLAERTEATVEDIDAAIEAALISASAYFDNVWLDAGEEGQAVLLARVRGDKIPDFPKAERWLVDREVLTDEGKFVVPVMERWVHHKITAELVA